MGVMAYWENSQQTAVVLRFSAPWTWAEFEVASAQLEAMVRAVPQRVDVLIHMVEAGGIPSDALLRMGEMYANQLPNLGEYVFMGAPAGFERTMAVTDRYYGVRGGHLAYRMAAAG